MQIQEALGNSWNTSLHRFVEFLCLLQASKQSNQSPTGHVLTYQTPNLNCKLIANSQNFALIRPLVGQTSDANSLISFSNVRQHVIECHSFQSTTKFGVGGPVMACVHDSTSKSIKNGRIVIENDVFPLVQVCFSATSSMRALHSTRTLDELYENLK